MAITNPLGCAIDAVIGSSQATSAVYKLSFDSSYFSPALRLTVFVLRLLADQDVPSLISEEQRRSAFLYFPLAIQLIDDNLTVAEANHIWNLYVDEIENEMTEIVSEGNSYLSGRINWTTSTDLHHLLSISPALTREYAQRARMLLGHASMRTHGGNGPEKFEQRPKYSTRRHFCLLSRALLSCHPKDDGLSMSSLQI